MSWRLAKSLGVLRDEVNARAPLRSKASDGTLGDPAHAARKSDHNPNAAGVVCAIDITDDPAHGHDDIVFAEHVRQLGAGGFEPLQHGGYVIANGRVAGGSRGWAWRPYSGPNAHAKHTHISANHVPGYDLLVPWGWHTPAAAPQEVDVIIVYAGAATADALGAAAEAFHRGLAGAVLCHDPAIARAALKTPQHRVVAIGGPSVREVFGEDDDDIGMRIVEGRHLVIVGSTRDETQRLAIASAQAGWKDVA